MYTNNYNNIFQFVCSVSKEINFYNIFDIGGGVIENHSTCGLTDSFLGSSLRNRNEKISIVKILDSVWIEECPLMNGFALSFMLGSNYSI
jgi:hypothetical protein